MLNGVGAIKFANLFFFANGFPVVSQYQLQTKNIPIKVCRLWCYANQGVSISIFQPVHDILRLNSLVNKIIGETDRKKGRKIRRHLRFKGMAHTMEKKT